jgi:hypothetical protein
VGGSTAIVIAGNKIAPAFGDWYLAQQGYDAQQYDGAADANRPNNLYEPLPGDHGAHGDFDARAHRFSWQLWADQNRGWLTAAGAIVGLLCGVRWLNGRNRAIPAKRIAAEGDERRTILAARQ